MTSLQERRHFPRMPTACGASYRRADERDVHTAVIRNISAGGMLLLTENELEIGVTLELRVEPGQLSIPVMSARVEVVRSMPAAPVEGTPGRGHESGVRVLAVK